MRKANLVAGEHEQECYRAKAVETSDAILFAGIVVLRGHDDYALSTSGNRDAAHPTDMKEQVLIFPIAAIGSASDRPAPAPTQPHSLLQWRPPLLTVQ
jgi:hypothetical protein